MNESRIEATDRLRREGRWSEASLWKDERVRQHRAEGRKGEASDLAWAEMIAEFPPLSQGTKTKALDPLDISGADIDLIHRLIAVPVDWDRDVMWCYQVYATPDVQLTESPSLAAWGLLRFARSEPQRFFAMVANVAANRLKVAMKGTDESNSLRETQDPGLADLKRMIAEMDAG